MAEAYIVEALRTAGGKRDGALKDWHPVSMGGAVLDALVQRTGIEPAAIDDVIVGCVGQIGEQAFHVGRNMVLASSLPPSSSSSSRRSLRPRTRTRTRSASPSWRSSAIIRHR